MLKRSEHCAGDGNLGREIASGEYLLQQEELQYCELPRRLLSGWAKSYAIQLMSMLQLMSMFQLMSMLQLMSMIQKQPCDTIP